MSSGALEYIREISSQLDSGHVRDCVVHACRLAELLSAGGESPWIARIRDTRPGELGMFHGPLSPVRLRGRNARTWTTHFVTCVGEYAFDPLAGEPLSLIAYPHVVFGRGIFVETFLDVQATEALLRTEGLMLTMRFPPDRVAGR